MRYHAFISYSHGADARLAPALQRALHRFAKPWWKARAVHVFRDETSLALAHSLPDTLTKALEASEHFILMASPMAAGSKWVAGECAWWAAHKPPERMLVVLSEGEIAWDDAAGDFDWAKTTAVPPALKGVFKHEPLYLDLRWTKSAETFSDRDPRFLDAVARISAALRGMSLEAIAGEEVRQHRKTRRVAYAAVSAIALLAAGASAGAWIATENAREAESQRAAAVRATEIAQAEETKAKAAREKEEAERIRAQTSQSRMLVGRAQEAYARGDATLGNLLLIEALPRRTPTGPSRVDVVEAIRLANERLWQSPRLITFWHETGRRREVLDWEPSSAVFSPDGRRILTAGFDKNARVWFAQTGLLALELRGHQKTVAAAEFSPTGRYIVTAGSDGTARLWDANDGRQVAVMGTGEERLIHQASFSPDGTRVVTASSDTHARVYEVPSGRELAVLRGHTDFVNTATFSRDGRFVVTSSHDGRARVWEAESGREVAVLRHFGGVFTAYFDPSGEFVVTASQDKTARIWEAKSGREIHVLRGHEEYVRKAVFDPSGQRVATASDDGTARLFDARNGREIATLRGHQDAIRDIQFSADGKRLATSSDDKTARVWDGKNGRAITALGGHRQTVTGAAFHPDGRWIATASWDDFVRLFELEPQTLSFEVAVGPLKAGLIEFGRAVLDRSGQRFVTLPAGFDPIRVWDIRESRDLATLIAGRIQVSSAEFSPDETRILTTYKDGTARLWNAETFKEEAIFRAGSPVQIGVFSPDGTQILLVVESGTAQLWDVAKRLKIAQFYSGSILARAAFSPNGKLIVATSGIVGRVWDVAQHQQIAELKGHTGNIRSASFSPDSTRIVTASDDGTARIWDASTGRELASLVGDGEQLIFATYDPEGSLIATVPRDSPIRLWEAARGREWMTLPGLGKHNVLADEPVGSVRFTRDGAWLVTVRYDGTVRFIPRPQVFDATLLADLLTLRTYRELTDKEREEHFLAKESALPAAESCEAGAAHPFDPANIEKARSGAIRPPLAAVIDRCRAELAARPGDPRLSFLLAQVLTAGRRHAEAKPYLETALNAGYAMAYYHEAQLYMSGADRSRDVAKAAESHRRAMERGVAVAAYDLGLMMWHAIGVPRDVAGAIALWRRAADADNPDAHLVLAKVSLAGWVQPAGKTEILFRYALAGRLFVEAGVPTSAALTQISQANLAQDLSVRDLLVVLDRLTAWKPAPQPGRLRE